jgi:hypothetical protein
MLIEVMLFDDVSLGIKAIVFNGFSIYDAWNEASFYVL